MRLQSAPLRSIVWALALWGVLAAAALAAGRLRWHAAGSPQTSGRHEALPADAGAAGSARALADEAHPAAPIPAAPAARIPNEADASNAAARSIAPSELPASVPRYTVCTAESELPELSVVALAPGVRPWIALHCGRTLHLIAARQGPPGSWTAWRVALVESKAEGLLRPGQVLATDLDGDGEAELLVGVRSVNPETGRHAGILARFRFALARGLSAPAALLRAGPGALTVGDFDARPGLDLVVAVPAPELLATPGEVWMLPGSGSAARRAKPGPLGALRALAAADVNRDGQDDLVMLGAGEPTLQVWLGDRRGAFVTRLQAQMQGARELVRADIADDKQPELVVVGEQLWSLNVDREQRLALRELGNVRNLRSVEFIDVDADGSVDLAGYDHPEVVAYRIDGGRVGARSTLASLSGDHAAVLATRFVPLVGGEPPGLVVVSAPSGSPKTIQISLLSAEQLVGGGVHLTPGSSPLPDAPLRLHGHLPRGT
ncbi:MAG: VCBS repeat-containing protein [Proteobacteria bacterium]|nr:VCBS repeat-containing protein [Pseudomonadota bacterium]